MKLFTEREVIKSINQLLEENEYLRKIISSSEIYSINHYDKLISDYLKNNNYKNNMNSENFDDKIGLLIEKSRKSHRRNKSDTSLKSDHADHSTDKNQSILTTKGEKSKHNHNSNNNNKIPTQNMNYNINNKNNYENFCEIESLNNNISNFNELENQNNFEAEIKSLKNIGNFGDLYSLKSEFIDKKVLTLSGKNILAPRLTPINQNNTKNSKHNTNIINSNLKNSNFSNGISKNNSKEKDKDKLNMLSNPLENFTKSKSRNDNHKHQLEKNLNVFNINNDDTDLDLEYNLEENNINTENPNNIIISNANAKNLVEEDFDIRNENNNTQKSSSTNSNEEVFIKCSDSNCSSLINNDARSINDFIEEKMLSERKKKNKAIVFENNELSSNMLSDLNFEVNEAKEDFISKSDRKEKFKNNTENLFFDLQKISRLENKEKTITNSNRSNVMSTIGKVNKNACNQANSATNENLISQKSDNSTNDKNITTNFTTDFINMTSNQFHRNNNENDLHKNISKYENREYLENNDCDIGLNAKNVLKNNAFIKLTETKTHAEFTGDAIKDEIAEDGKNYTYLISNKEGDFNEREENEYIYNSGGYESSYLFATTPRELENKKY